MSEKQNRVATGGGRLSEQPAMGAPSSEWARYYDGRARALETRLDAIDSAYEDYRTGGPLDDLLEALYAARLETGHRNSGGHQDSNSGAR